MPEFPSEFRPVIDPDEIRQRLNAIFPEGTPHRGYLTREIAARTLFVMIYVGTIEGDQGWVRPNQVTRMTDEQASLRSDSDRRAWIAHSMAKLAVSAPGQWYATDTREPIRDETLRQGFVATGAVVERPGIPTTSAKPRYAIAKRFYGLLATDPADSKRGQELTQWRADHLNAGQLTRLRLIKRSDLLTKSTDRIAISLPDGQTRWVLPGPSGVIAKSVIESFVTHFLQRPVVLFLSESGKKIDPADNARLLELGLKIDASKQLPDLILFDANQQDLKLIFVEIVATDGEITLKRQQALLTIATEAEFTPPSVYFVSAFSDRGSTAFRKHAAELAWGSFAWFASEPENLVRFESNAQLNHTVLSGAPSSN